MSKLGELLENVPKYLLVRKMFFIKIKKILRLEGTKNVFDLYI